ncbi:thiamine diphosphokinase [Maledivibacter halophilus]|uniref:Thiamine diphosphokinase n=1 Tax=Maledivibacter halophilus TaxID=36842 RepID=A0A1T5MGY4_9FIRM|nr:thiamine diphosphokinase [Maledivibacter halophilus]SKC87194.1 thiamine diphosphokinase [Maledivibacter halophilus]
MKCIIVSNGDIYDYSFYKDILDDSDYIICADGGAKHLIKMDIAPNIIIGDFDSITPEDKALFMEKNIEFYKFPRNKDATDTELALDLAISKKPSEIIFIGTIGSRMDHTIANVTLLKKVLDNGIKGRIINENNEICLLNNKNSKMILSDAKGYYISIIPLSVKVKGVTLKGLKYPLKDVEIPLGSTLGISNEIDKDLASIEFKEGLLLIIKAKD